MSKREGGWEGKPRKSYRGEGVSEERGRGERERREVETLWRERGSVGDGLEREAGTDAGTP